MSLVTDILERLSGLTAVRERLADTNHQVNKVADWLLDHERRLVRLEERSAPPAPAAPKKKRTVKKRS